MCKRLGKEHMDNIDDVLYRSVWSVEDVNKRKALIEAYSPEHAVMGRRLENGEVHLRDLSDGDARLALACVSVDALYSVAAEERRQNVATWVAHHIAQAQNDANGDHALDAEVRNVCESLANITYADDADGSEGYSFNYKNEHILHTIQRLFDEYSSREVARSIQRMKDVAPDYYYEHLVDWACAAWLTQPDLETENVWGELWRSLWVDTSDLPNSVGVSLHAYWQTGGTHDWIPKKGLGVAASIAYLNFNVNASQAEDTAKIFTFTSEAMETLWGVEWFYASSGSSALFFLHKKDEDWFTETNTSSLLRKFSEVKFPCMMKVIEGLSEPKKSIVTKRMMELAEQGSIAGLFYNHRIDNCGCVELLVEKLPTNLLLLDAFDRWDHTKILNLVGESNRADIFRKMDITAAVTLLETLPDGMRKEMAQNCKGLAAELCSANWQTAQRWMFDWLCEELNNSPSALRVAGGLIENNHMTLVDIVTTTKACMQ